MIWHLSVHFYKTLESFIAIPQLSLESLYRFISTVYFLVRNNWRKPWTKVHCKGMPPKLNWASLPSCELLIRFLTAVISNLCHISQVSALFPALPFIKRTLSLLHWGKRAISSSYLLSTWEIAFVLSLSQSLISCLRRRKVFSELVLYYFCSLVQISFSSVSILIKSC